MDGNWRKALLEFCLFITLPFLESTRSFWKPGRERTLEPVPEPATDLCSTKGHRVAERKHELFGICAALDKILRSGICLPFLSHQPPHTSTPQAIFSAFGRLSRMFSYPQIPHPLELSILRDVFRPHFSVEHPELLTSSNLSPLLPRFSYLSKGNR